MLLVIIGDINKFGICRNLYYSLLVIQMIATVHDHKKNLAPLDGDNTSSSKMTVKVLF
jgi:hypothetical protein